MMLFSSVALENRSLEQSSESIPKTAWRSDTERMKQLTRLVRDTVKFSLANREAALLRMAELIAAALVVEAPRVKTKPSRSARERRLVSKRRRSETKSTRSSRPEPHHD